MRAAEEDLRPPILAHHLEDQAADAIVDAHHLARDLRVAADDALGAAKIDDDMAEFDALDDAGDDHSDATLAFLELALAPGVADPLEEDFPKGLPLDPEHTDRKTRND